MIRSTGAFLQGYCSTRPGGNYDVNGTVSCLRLETLPPDFHKAEMNSYIDYAVKNSHRLNMSVMDGFAMV